MRKFIIIFFSLILANCSLNKDSQYWTENSIENKNKSNIKKGRRYNDNDFRGI